MKPVTKLAVTALLWAAAGAAAAQPAADALVGSWTLVSAEKDIAADEPTRVRAPRGLLIIDGAGYVFEFFHTPTDQASESPQRDPAQTLADYGGFWGRYEIATTGRIDFEAEDGVSPDVHGLAFSRSYELDGDRLVMSSSDEPQAQGHTRWVYQRFPTVENLSPAYREVVGFWQHVVERQVNIATGEVLRSTERAPSVIVYTPAGFVGVHFPPMGREPFANTATSAEEAQAGLRGYIGYFGTLGVYPGEVTHNLLSGISPATGSILRRTAEITGDELVVRLQPLGTQAQQPQAQQQDDRPRTVTEVVLRRLSGADDMLPR